MKITSTILALSMLLTASCSGNKDAADTKQDNRAKKKEIATKSTEKKLTSYVNPLIGSGGHGHVFVGANMPFGMVQLGPTSINQTWDWCSGYHQDEVTVIGFSHTHLSGTGIGDLFDVTVMPVTGEVTYARGTVEEQNSGMWSPADRTQEKAEPGYYSVPLTRYGIKAEMTATARVGLHRYTFPEAEDAAIVIDLQNGGCWDQTTEASMQAEGNNRIVGYRYSKGWAKNQRIYFVAEFAKPFESFELKGEQDMYGRASFSTAAGEEVMLKVAISPVSIEGAKLALEKELPGWDFAATQDAAVAAKEQGADLVVVFCNRDCCHGVPSLCLFTSQDRQQFLGGRFAHHDLQHTSLGISDAAQDVVAGAVYHLFRLLVGSALCVCDGRVSVDDRPRAGAVEQLPDFCIGQIGEDGHGAAVSVIIVFVAEPGELHLVLHAVDFDILRHHATASHPAG